MRVERLSEGLFTTHCDPSCFPESGDSTDILRRASTRSFELQLDSLACDEAGVSNVTKELATRGPGSGLGF